MAVHALRTLLLWFLSFTISHATFQIIRTGEAASSSSISLTPACITALESSVTCDGNLTGIVKVDNYIFPDAVYKGVCTNACNSSLATYHKNVVTSCGNTSQPWPGLPATYWGDYYWASFNLTCLSNPTNGASCMAYMANLSQTYTSGTPLAKLPTSVICSPCIIALYRLYQSTPFSPYDSGWATDWASVQKSCNKTYPTAVPSVTASPTWPNYAPSGAPVATGCASGTNYTVASGDTCTAISKSKSVGTGALIVLNQLLTSCSNLKASQTLCLPPKCTTYTVQSGDTCNSITNSTNISITQFMAWNTLIDPFCETLQAGWSVCVSQPGTVWTGTTIAGATVTQSAVYATATIAAPSNIAHGTTTKCGKYYTVVSGDNCNLIALNNTITVGLFQSINPSINSDCTNLTPGLAYCIFPTSDWNATSATVTSTYVSAPAPTPSGTTGSCYQWHTVVSGDYCGLLLNQYGITMAQLQLWNPSLKDDCSNLILGDAYCVNAGSNPPNPTTTSSKTTAKAAVRAAATK